MVTHGPSTAGELGVQSPEPYAVITPRTRSLLK